jgi:hypothetical protein
LGIKTIMASGRSGAEIDHYAFCVIKRYQSKVIESPQPFAVDEFFELDLEGLTGVVPDYDILPSGIYGMTDSVDCRSTISSEMVDDPLQIKFARSTIAHECGHAILHVPEFRAKRKLLRSVQGDASIRLYRQQDIPTYRNPEWQAHRFAAGLLMPGMMVEIAVREGAKSLAELSDIFNVSEPFVRSRLKTLGIMFKNEKGDIAVSPFSAFSGYNPFGK